MADDYSVTVVQSEEFMYLFTEFNTKPLRVTAIHKDNRHYTLDTQSYVDALDDASFECYLYKGVCEEFTDAICEQFYRNWESGILQPD